MLRQLLHGAAGRGVAARLWPSSFWHVRQQAKMQDQPSDRTTFETLHEFVAAAKRNLTKATWDYLMGGAETETTLERNRRAIDALAFRPRVLRNVEHVTTRGTLLGQELRLPVILAPIGSLQDMVRDGGIAP